MMHRKVVAAAAQISPVYMDKSGTIDKVCETIAEAARNGADLVVFPETVIPGYPYWRSVQPNSTWAELMTEYQRQSITVGTDDTRRLGEAARDHNIVAVIGCTEMSDRPGSGTLYNTMLFFSAEGELIGRHRKLIPTHAERLVWGAGDGADLRVFDTPLGALGGLVCFEHHVTLFKAAMCQLGEEIHCAVWPGWFHQEHHPGIKRRWKEGDGLESCDILHAVREYAFETQTFVVSASQWIADAELPDYAQGFNIAAGGSMIVNATGLYLAEPVFGRETILYAELDPAERMAMKAYFDALGHYSRPDVVGLRLGEALQRVVEEGRTFEVPRREMARLADSYQVSVGQVEAIVAELSSLRIHELGGAGG